MGLQALREKYFKKSAKNFAGINKIINFAP